MDPTLLLKKFFTHPRVTVEISPGAVLKKTASLPAGATITGNLKKHPIDDMDDIRSSNINTTTTNGVIPPDRFLSIQAKKHFTEKSRNSVDGKKRVWKKIKISDRGDSPEKMSNPFVEANRILSDIWITARVKAVILANNVRKGFRVNVKTTHGIVFLKGILPNQGEIDLLKGIAEKGAGGITVDASRLRSSGRSTVS